MRRSITRIATVIVLVGGTLAASMPYGATQTDPKTDGRYRQFGDAGGFRNIIPPGQDGTLTAAELTQARNATDGNNQDGYPPHFGDQRILYNDLVFETPINQRDLGQYFKDESFGVKADDIDRVYSPHNDVTVIRDKSFGVPHIYGNTRYATMYAEGFTTAEDRLFFMDILRHVGRATLAQLVGPIDIALRQDADTLANAPYTEQDFEEQLAALKHTGPGSEVAADFQAYTDGVNAYIDATKKDPSLLAAEYGVLAKQPAAWKTSDAIAIAADVGGIYGYGGGREIDNLCGKKTLETRLGKDAGAQLFTDLKFANSPAAPVTSHRRTPYSNGLGPVDPASQPDVDCTSLRDVGGAAAPTSAGMAGAPAWLHQLIDGLHTQQKMSNAILVSGAHTKSGRPIAVFGPQIGYSVPALLVEKDVHGPGIDARGVGFLGVDAYVLLGRGTDYAWSATSSGADNVDEFVLKLCDRNGGAATLDAMGYEHDGKCQAIETFEHNTGVPGAPPVIVQRSADFGPIIQRGTLADGTPIAVARKRSTYGSEIESAIGFKELNDPKVMEGGFDAFRRAVGEGIDYTFNWFYVDATTIGYEHSCKCPLRAKGTDPDLPAWGTGEWDWHGFLPLLRQPYEANPARGFISSWNNKQAPDFRASDAEFAFGPVHRVDMLNSRLERLTTSKKKVVPADVVNLMEDAGTVDLRGQELLPVLLKLLGTDPPAGIDPRALDLRERLEIWKAQGAHRRATDATSGYEDPVAPAVMDAWWPEIVDAVFGESAGKPFQALQLTLDDNPRSHGGSAFLDGAYSPVAQDLRQVAGVDVPGAWKKTYCGGGDRAKCHDALWVSLGAAVQSLEAEFKSPDVASWQRTPTDDQIEFDTLVAPMLPMNWVDRPTFQQVVQLETRGKARKSETATKKDDTATIIVSIAIGLAIGAVIGYFMRRRIRRQLGARP